MHGESNIPPSIEYKEKNKKRCKNVIVKIKQLIKVISCEVLYIH